MTGEKRIIFLFIILLPLFGIAGAKQISSTGIIGVKDEVFDTTNINGYQYFKKKGVRFDSTSNISLYNELIKWIGVPYRYAGKTKAGVDCSGFAGVIFKAIYSVVLPGGAQNIYKLVTPVMKEELKEGDLVFFKIRRSSISHVGIYLSNGKFIHATSYGKTVTISDLNEHYYKTYYYSGGRINNTKDLN